MGFFSKLKRFWKGENEAAVAEPEKEAIEPSAVPEEQPSAPAEAHATQAAPQAAAETAPAPEVVAEETAPEAAQAPQAVEPQAAQPQEKPQAAPQVTQVTEPQERPQTAPPAVPEHVLPWRDELVVALREAEPRLSSWLGILLEGIDRAGPELWDRLRFLFSCLDAPEGEAEAFVEAFSRWVANMGYEELEDFRSELQYRLALALDLEDEEDERSRLFLKLSESLAKTKESLSKRIDSMLGKHETLSGAFYDELEEILIMADLGFEATTALLERLKKAAKDKGLTTPAEFRAMLGDELAAMFTSPKRITAVNPPEVVMIIGVNGVGKTTTIAKLAHRARLKGRKTLIAAADTFRAAAIEQLGHWAGRVEAEFYSKGENADPAAVAYEALDKALELGSDIVFVDTAGRLHTKLNLMEELKKVKRVLAKKHPGAPHRVVLVLDATTGQNALSQTKLFHEAVDIDEIILTKLDGSAKGGIAVAIAASFSIPITYVGLGEKMEDLRPFSGEDFAKALLE